MPDDPPIRPSAADAATVLPHAPPTVQIPASFVGASPAAPKLPAVGEEIGPYRLAEVLGEGGLGVVYRAEQLRPVRRVVAVKLIKLGMDSAEMLARFEAERQALALMEHANIARVFDAGVTPAGRPYFAMEYVRGEPINLYCDRLKLTVRQRLELFVPVCEAVQHAHNKGIVHRDLKPGNVLVAEGEAGGPPRPVVIDFGIAKALDQRLTERTLFTHAGQLVGTPEYMSPEQAAGDAAAVDTRTDVYALGVMLYELLTGLLPFDPKSLRNVAYREIERIIREVDPPRPSTRLLTAVGEARAIAAARGEAVDALARSLRRELEWIPLRAMRKEPDGRYRSATEFADDVRNYLAGRPLMAAPASRRYRTRKFLRRHRGATAAAAAMLALLLGGIAATTTQAVRATRAERDAVAQRDAAEAQRALAERRFEDVRQLADTFMFQIHDAVEPLAGSTKARQLLVETALKYLGRLRGDVAAGGAVDAELAGDLAAAYAKVGDIQGGPGSASLGDATAAKQSYLDAQQVAQTALDAGVADAKLAARLRRLVADESLQLAGLAQAADDPAEALRLLESARDAYVGLRANDPANEVLRINGVLIRLRMADAQEDTNRSAEAIALLRGAAGDVDPATYTAGKMRERAAGVRSNLEVRLASLLRRGGRADEAVEVMDAGIARAEAESRDRPDDATSQSHLATLLNTRADALSDLGRDDEALASVRRSADLSRKLAAADPLDARAATAAALAEFRLADLEAVRIPDDTAEGDPAFETARVHYAEAAALYQAVAARGEAGGGGVNSNANRMLTVLYGQLAQLETKAGRTDASVDAVTKAIDLTRRLIEGAPDNLPLQLGLAYYLDLRGSARADAGDVSAAADDFRAAVQVNEAAAAADADNANVVRNLVKYGTDLGEALTALSAAEPDGAKTAALRDEARRALIEARDRVESLAERGALPASEEYRRGRVAESLRQLDAPTTRPAAPPRSLFPSTAP